ncbi:hypothetical protein GDO78_003902 [Eleutherodactylus coqui]|uniref:Uncharacterized protein n=1 Tax=Eleutherodactylus coqui TaxID=57060 RepID=A0A8J6EVY7_ELECQ|nr:hypothetical protein GDO78_003902 [Eleutherodactylus coqui]
MLKGQKMCLKKSTRIIQEDHRCLSIDLSKRLTRQDRMLRTVPETTQDGIGNHVATQLQFGLFFLTKSPGQHSGTSTVVFLRTSDSEEQQSSS